MKTIQKDEKINIDPNDTNCITVGNYDRFFYTPSFGNCKHCTINSVSYGILYGDRVNFIKILNETLNKAMKLVFTINVTDLSIIEILKKEFIFVDMVAIPIGYGKKYQYHATFFTNYVNYHDRESYIARVKKNQEKKEEKTKNFNLTPTIIDKILAYSSKIWLKKYLLKLANGENL